MTREIKRGDIYIADLEPVIGSEQGGIRPVLIIQNDLGNKYSETVIVAALTSQNKVPMPTHILLKHIKKIERNSVVLLEQIRTINKSRLQKYLFSLDESDMCKVDSALLISFGLNGLIHMPFRMFLCSECALRLGYSSDYAVKRVEGRTEKESCMHCFRRQGYEYNVYRKLNEK